MNIKQIMETVDVDMPVKEFSGTVKTILTEWKVSYHEKYGKSSIQNVIVADESGEVFCNVTGHTKLNKGESIKVVAHKSDKHGYTGIKVSEYNGKKQIKVSASANIDTLTTTPTAEPKQQDTTPKPKQQPETTTNWNEKEIRTVRGMCLSYAKDLVVCGKIDITDIEKQAENFVSFVYDKKDDTNIPF